MENIPLENVVHFSLVTNILILLYGHERTSLGKLLFLILSSTYTVQSRHPIMSTLYQSMVREEGGRYIIGGNFYQRSLSRPVTYATRLHTLAGFIGE